MIPDNVVLYPTTEQIEGLGVAMNEAALLGAELSEERRVAGVTLSVLTLPENGQEPTDPRLQILLINVGRAAASLRMGNWDDPDAAVVTFPPSELLEVVQSFEASPIYGWEFFDVAEKELAKWFNKFSFDVSLSETSGRSHSLCLFQEGAGDRHLDLCFWFDSLELRNAAGEALSLEQVIAAGRRWWEAFRKGDPRTEGHGMVPLRD